MENNQDYIKTIADQLIKSANLAKLPEAEEEVFRSNLEVQINRRLGLVIMQNLDDNGLKEYEELIKKGNPSPEEMTLFLSKNLPNAKEIIKKGMDEFIKEALEALTL